MSDRSYLQHGRRHGSQGTDAVLSDWHIVGDPGEAAFQNSWVNTGGSRVPMRWRFKAVKDPAADQPAIEVQGSVTGGTPGTTVFTLPLTLDYDLHLAATDDGGSFVCVTILQSGDVVQGFV